MILLFFYFSTSAGFLGSAWPPRGPWGPRWRPQGLWKRLRGPWGPRECPRVHGVCGDGHDGRGDGYEFRGNDLVVLFKIRWCSISKILWVTDKPVHQAQAFIAESSLKKFQLEMDSISKLEFLEWALSYKFWLHCLGLSFSQRILDVEHQISNPQVDLQRSVDI